MTAGPFHTEAQAAGSPAVRAAYDAARSADPRGRLTPRGVMRLHSHRLICSALTDAGVRLGDYDHDVVVSQLAALDPHVVAVVAGLITRASAGAGR